MCVYDNASGDETAQVVAELAEKDSRVKYHCHQENIGAGKNFNFGLSKIDTSYFSILSDDDILLPDFYKKAIEGFKKYPEAIFSATQTIIAINKRVEGISFSDYEEKLYQPSEGLLEMSNLGFVTWTGILFKKEVIEKVGILDEKVRGPADCDFLLRIASAFPYVVLKSPGAIFFIHKLSWSSTISPVESFNGFIKILEKIKNNKKIPASIREIVLENVRKYTIRFLWFGGFMDITKRNFIKAKQSGKFLKNDFNENLKSDILYYSARLCEFSNIFYYIFYYSFFGLNKIRKSINIKKKLREKKFQNMYGTYLKYI